MAKQDASLEASIISTVLSSDETAELKALCDRIGVSTSHLSRALLRVGLTSVRNSTNIEKTLLKLIKLGK